MVDQVQVERIAKRRAVCARLMAVVLLLTGVHDLGALHGWGNLGVNSAMGTIWIVMILGFVLFAGGGLTPNPATRNAIYDESTIEHGRRGFALGFWTTLVVCGGYWIAALGTSIGGVEVARAVVTFSVAAALLRFATLEAKALKE